MHFFFARFCPARRRAKSALMASGVIARAIDPNENSSGPLSQTE